jgi:ankyrin repeat protein
MKKVLLGVAVLALGVFAFIGCSKDDVEEVAEIDIVEFVPFAGPEKTADMFNYVRENRPLDELVNFMETENVDPNAVDPNENESLLVQTIRKGNVEFVRYLLAQGANPNVTDNSGTTALALVSAGGPFVNEEIRVMLEQAPAPQPEAENM